MEALDKSCARMRVASLISLMVLPRVASFVYNDVSHALYPREIMIRTVTVLYCIYERLLHAALLPHAPCSCWMKR